MSWCIRTTTFDHCSEQCNSELSLQVSEWEDIVKLHVSIDLGCKNILGSDFRCTPIMLVLTIIVIIFMPLFHQNYFRKSKYKLNYRVLHIFPVATCLVLCKVILSLIQNVLCKVSACNKLVYYVFQALGHILATKS